MKVLFVLLVSVTLLVNKVSAQFVQEPLPYAYNALEPFIDAQTMEIHFSKHHLAYINNLNAELKNNFPGQVPTMDELLKNMSKYNMAVRNNGGGHYNHTLFWKLLSAKKTEPSAELLKAIVATFGSMDELKTKLNKEGTSRFGSGWAWLIVTADKKLAVTSTPNQDNPLMDVAPVKGAPILAFDVWEHAYYLKYQNKRADYLQALWSVVNWEYASELYSNALKATDK